MDNLGQPFGQTVTVHTRQKTGQDRYHNDVFTSVDVDVPGCSVWPRGASELVQGQDMAITGLSVLLPARSVDVNAIDGMRVYGVEYEVDGEPGRFVNPIDGTDGGTQIALTRITG